MNTSSRGRGRGRGTVPSSSAASSVSRPAPGPRTASSAPSSSKPTSSSSSSSIANQSVPTYGAKPQLWNAVALQSHLAKSFGVDLSTKPRGIPSMSRPLPAAAGGAAVTAALSSQIHNHSHSHSHNHSHNHSHSPAQQQQQQQQHQQQRLPSIIEGDVMIPIDEPTKKKLSLAQKLGLVEKPPEPLSAAEWKAVHATLKQRQDTECSICREEFQDEDQVLLSCSHTFHRACLASFERFADTKACPVCRSSKYQKVLVNDGKQLYREKCAVKIQSLIRGFLARRRVYRMQMENNPELKRAFAAKRVARYNDKVLKRMELEQVSIDDFLDSIDRSLARSKLQYFTTEDWQSARTKALERGAEECAICCCDMDLLQSAAPAAASSTAVRECVLLSCSHVFHDKCIDSFERFSTEQTKVCPVCRATYSKRSLSDAF